MALAPIALFAYNRPHHLQKAVEALQNNSLAKDSDLFIFSDAPKNPEVEENVVKVRKYIKSISGFKNVIPVERKKNLGVAKSIIYGVTEIVNRFGKIIVLEDDLVSSPYFLRYMNEALEFYQNEERVISAHGYMYPLKAKLPSTFLLRFSDCLGWGTWQRGWALFEPDGQKLLKELKERNLEKRFDINHSYPYTRMLKNQIEGRNDSWAIRWYASTFLRNRLSLYPGKSLIQHIGNDESGVNFGVLKILDVDLTDQHISIEKIAVEEEHAAMKQIGKYFKSIRPLRLINSVQRRMIKLYKITRRQV